VSTKVPFRTSKIWLSILNRQGDVSNLPHTHIICDEIHKYQQVTKLLYGWIREAAKYKTNFVISSHTLLDLKSLLPVFKAAGSHYMLFKSSPQNYKLLEQELMPYTMEELMQIIKPFHSMNIINYNRDYVSFLSKTCDPVDKIYKYADRSYLDLECSKKYGFEYKD
jgi:hypothetical protein